MCGSSCIRCCIRSRRGRSPSLAALVLAVARRCSTVREIASGWLRIATDRGGQTVIRMRGLGPVNAAWKVPTILTDASLQIELVRHLWPEMLINTFRRFRHSVNYRFPA